MKVGIIGAGRIGKVHAKNISMFVPDVELKTAADPSVVVCDEQRTSSENTYKIMWDRYTGAFVAEIQAFAEAVQQDKEPAVTGMDGLYPVLMAAAATKSLKEGRPVKISEVE